MKAFNTSFSLKAHMPWSVKYHQGGILEAGFIHSPLKPQSVHLFTAAQKARPTNQQGAVKCEISPWAKECR